MFPYLEHHHFLTIMDEQQSRQTIASLRHFLRKLCPPLLLTIVHTNGSSKQVLRSKYILTSTKHLIENDLLFIF